MDGRKRIIVALDCRSAKDACALVRSLSNDVGMFKIGFELIYSMMSDIIAPKGISEAYANMEHMRNLFSLLNGRVFIDAKLHDIPNTVSGAIKAIVNLEPALVNVHCSGGLVMMEKAKKSVLSKANSIGIDPPKVIGVTILTSLDFEALRQMGFLREPNPNQLIGFKEDEDVLAVENLAFELACLAKEAGLDGVVCSPHEIESIRSACGPDFLIVTPGVRPAGTDVQDQKRVMTPGEAISLGADYLVIGRPITKADDPAAAAQAINVEINDALRLRKTSFPEMEMIPGTNHLGIPVE